MACVLTNGVTLDCRTGSSGGLKSIWLLGGTSGATVNGSITGYTQSSQNSSITSVSGSGVWYKFNLVKQSSSFQEDIAIADIGQSVTFQPTLTINLPKLQTSLRDIFFSLVGQNEVYAIIEDNNEKYWAVYWSNGGYVNAGSMLLGQNYNDQQGIQLVIFGGEPEASKEIVLSAGQTLQSIMTGMTIQL